MGEKQNQPFQLSVSACLKVDVQGSRVTPDGGVLLVRELDERMGLSAHRVVQGLSLSSRQLEDRTTSSGED
jgi:hypothetical protein